MKLILLFLLSSSFTAFADGRTGENAKSECSQQCDGTDACINRRLSLGCGVEVTGDRSAKDQSVKEIFKFDNKNTKKQ